MMVEEPSSPQEQSPTRIIKDVLSGLEPEVFELTIVVLEVSKEIGIGARAAGEVSEDRGIKEEA